MPAERRPTAPQVENKIRTIEQAINQHQNLVQQKMDELPDEKREMWFKLQEEDSQLTTETARLEKQVPLQRPLAHLAVVSCSMPRVHFLARLSMRSNSAAATAQVDEISQTVRDQEDFLRRDPVKQQALAIMSSVSKLEKDKEQLEKDTAHLRLSFPEQKKLLLDQVQLVPTADPATHAHPAHHTIGIEPPSTSIRD